jgi:hypothetical protein
MGGRGCTPVISRGLVQYRVQQLREKHTRNE